MIMPNISAKWCLSLFEIEGRVFTWEKTLVGELRISGNHVKKKAKFEEAEEGPGELYREGLCWSVIFEYQAFVDPEAGDEKGKEDEVENWSASTKDGSSEEVEL